MVTVTREVSDEELVQARAAAADAKRAAQSAERAARRARQRAKIKQQHYEELLRWHRGEVPLPLTYDRD